MALPGSVIYMVGSNVMALVSPSLAGDRAAEFDNFFLSTVRRTVAYIAIVTRDVAAAEDAAQEAYTRAYRRWDRVRKLDRPDLWVVRVGSNVAISAWKKRKHENRLTTDQDQWMRWGLTSLSQSQRVAFVLRHAEGLEIAEVAANMGASESTVRTHLQRARQRLQSLFTQDLNK